MLVRQAWGLRADFGLMFPGHPVVNLTHWLTVAVGTRLKLPSRECGQQLGHE